MIAPSRSLTAQRIFTDRDAPKKIFEGALSGLRPDRYCVLAWYGVGGQGKSELCEEYRLRIEQRRENGEAVALAKLDFEIARHRSPVDALLALRLQLGSEIAFPTFDVAFARLFATEHPGADLRAAHPGLFARHSGGIADLLDVLHQTVEGAAGVGALAGAVSLPAALLPGLGLLPGAGLLYKYGTLLTGELRAWWERRDVRAHVNDIANFSAERLREQLPVYFGFDLRGALAQSDSPRIVILVDSYEALWRDRAAQGSLQSLRADNWVRAIVQESQGALVAIFGRDKLRWGELDNGWNAVLDQHLLGGLSDHDADWYLTTVGIESEAVRTRILTGAGGLPFYLDLARVQYERISAAGREPVVDDFADTPTEVVERFLDHLSESELADLRLASYPEEIDADLFGDLCAQFLGGAACGDWARLGRRSYMTPNDRNTTRMHAVLRAELQKRERRDRPRFHCDLHAWLSRRYEAAATAPSAREIDESHDSAFLAAVRHLTLSDPRRLVPWILEPRHKALYDAGRWRALAEAFDIIATAIEQLPSNGNAELIWFHHHRGHVSQSIGLDHDAKALFATARELHRREHGADDPDYATIVHALADSCRRLGDEPEAERLYAEAVRIYAARPDVHVERHADALLSLALLDEAAGRTGEADRTRSEAREKLSAPGRDVARSRYADFLLKLGRMRRAHGRAAAAERLFAEALAEYGSSSPRAEGYAAALLDHAECLAARNALESARAGFAEALAIYDDALGQQHPNYGRALHVFARFRLEDADERMSVVADLTRAVTVLETSLGNEHIWTYEARADLQRAATS